VSCPSCGFDGAHLSPSDAIVALRSFPRRFTELLDRPAAEGAVDDPRGRVLAAAGWAAAAIAGTGEALRVALIEDDPEVGPDWATRPVAEGGPVPESLGGLTSAADTVANLASSTAAEAWKREAHLGTTKVTVLELLREAVHAGAHYLRAGSS